MKKILICLALGACTPVELVSAAKGECDLIGYAAGTPEHTACVERGYRDASAAQEQIATELAWWAILEAAY